MIILTMALPLVWSGCNTQTANANVITEDSEITSLKKGDEVTFIIALEGAPTTQTFGLKPLFDEEYFTMIGTPELLIECEGFSNYSNNMFVVVFDEETNLNGNFMKFTLKAIKETSETTVNCEISLKNIKNNTVNTRVTPWSGSIEVPEI